MTEDGSSSSGSSTSSGGASSGNGSSNSSSGGSSGSSSGVADASWDDADDGPASEEASAHDASGNSSGGSSGGGDDAGACGTACSTSIANATAECIDGACTFACNSGYTLCNGACVDEQTDSCACGLTMCGSECVDLSTDPNHCGSCSTTCSSGLCGTSIAGWTTSPTLWTLNGNATLGSGPFGTSSAILTGAVASEVGTIIYAHPIVTDSFTATFSIYLGGGPGGGNDGDGMGFMWQTQGATALGGSGGCLGMCGLPGFGVEFDTYNNDACGDMNSNHVAVDELSGCSEAFPAHIAATGSTLPTLDGTSHSVLVTLASGAVSVTVDDMSWLSGVSLPGFVSGTAYYFGFAGGTGGVTDAHMVSPSLSITFPTPRCL